MLIKNARVLNGQTGRFEDVPLHVQDGKIAAFADVDDADVFDGAGLYVIPGFIDTHIHGYVGVEFAKKGGGFTVAQEVLAAEGTTGFAATVRCMELQDMTAAAENIAAQMKLPQTGAKILGIHAEGPFVSHQRCGAMIPPDVECSVDNAASLIDAGDGQLKIMTLAPERENALDVIAYADKRGVACSMGHTDATFQEACRGVDAGAVRATHVFNAMRPLSHRETGILGVALTDERVTGEMIADFIHLDPAAVKLILRAKGIENVTLISDAGAQSGLPDGDYVVGGRVRHVRDGLCLNDDGRIAGSCFSMLCGAKNLLSLGVSLEDIALMASVNPAKALGIFEQTGSIAVGKCADLIVCDEALNIKAVFVDGVLQKTRDAVASLHGDDIDVL